MIVENTITPEWPGTDNMPVGKNVTPLGIDDKPGGLTTHGQIGVERACLTKMDRDDALHHRLNGRLPLRRVRLGCP